MHILSPTLAECGINTSLTEQLENYFQCIYSVLPLHITPLVESTSLVKKGVQYFVAHTRYPKPVVSLPN